MRVQVLMNTVVLKSILISIVKAGTQMSAFSKEKYRQVDGNGFRDIRTAVNVHREKVVLSKHEEVINQATIQSALGRSFRITGIDSAAEAHNLALLLRAGALIAPISIVEERTIGPSMGQQKYRYGYSGVYLGYGCCDAIYLTLLS